VRSQREVSRALPGHGREDARVGWLKALRRYWKPVRAVVGLALVGMAVWALTGKSSELSGASTLLENPHWGWLVLAAGAELTSFMAAAALELVLLKAGGVAARLRRLTAVTFASNSVQAALPVGAAFAGLYLFRQYQFLGADEILAGWVVVATSMVAFAVIAGLAGVALSLAASTGTTFDLVGVILGVVALAMVAVAIWANRARLYEPAARAVSALERALHRPAGQLRGPLHVGFERMRTIAPTRSEWTEAWVASLVNWLADCSSLGFAFLAVGGGVPWRGLLLAYCGAQLATLLPITPGGLGVVEGSLTVALVAFGGGKATTVAAVLFYRLFSFWVPLPIGAGCYLGLSHARRRALRLGGATPSGDAVSASGQSAHAQAVTATGAASATEKHAGAGTAPLAGGGTEKHAGAGTAPLAGETGEGAS